MASQAQRFDINTKYKLLSGHEMPVLGFGVSSAPPFHIGIEDTTGVVERDFIVSLNLLE